MTVHPPLRAAALGVALALAAPAGADVWVLEPSVGLDQRFDDNYSLDPFNPDEVSATRAVGELGLSRESQTASVRGLLRADLLLTRAGEEDGGNDLESNQIAGIETRFGTRRTRYGVDLGFKQDTPSRDIAGDLVVGESVATDTGTVDQENDVARRRFTISPTLVHELSRRTSLEGRVTYTDVRHDTADPDDLIYEQYLALLNNPNLPPERFDELTNGTGEPLPPGEVTIETTGPFTPTGELDDFREVELEAGVRYKLSPIVTLSATVATSRYVAEVEPDPRAFVPFEDLVSDGAERDIRRKPRRESVSETSSLRLGYDRALSPTLAVGLQAGLYVNRTDDNDTLRIEDRPPDEIFASPEDAAFVQGQFDERFGTLESSENGWLANVTLRKDAGLTRYVGRFAVDVQPSSAGSQVETQELIGEVFREINPLLDLSLRARAYEPDRLGAKPDDEFARRFISVEPRVAWRFARDWEAGASYRYRRQKSRAVAESADSNALLFFLRWTAPSRVRDLEGG